MSATADEYIETLNAEQFVDLQKLRSFARYGIPASVRGEVWLYLLGVLSPDRTNEITSVRSKYASYISMDKSALSYRIRLDCTRYYESRLLPYTRRRRYIPNANAALLPAGQGNGVGSGKNGPVGPTQPKYQEDEPMDIMAFTTSVENILSAYLNRNRNVEWQNGLVHLSAPFVWTLKTEAGMFFCFERLMSIMEDYTVVNPLPARISFLLSLVRQSLPDLYNYLEEEAFDLQELASTWLQWLFAKEMQIAMLMRLWDLYFAVPDPLDFHNYVCLAILTTCKEAIEELDQSEIRSMLMSLPVMDVDRLMVEANNLRLSYQYSQTRKDLSFDP